MDFNNKSGNFKLSESNTEKYQESKYKSNEINKEDNSTGAVEKFLNYICRHYNWIVVLMLTPISLIYDLYCFCKYSLTQMFIN